MAVTRVGLQFAVHKRVALAADLADRFQAALIGVWAQPVGCNEWVFGGVTRELLATSPIFCCLFSHRCTIEVRRSHRIMQMPVPKRRSLQMRLFGGSLSQYVVALFAACLGPVLFSRQLEAQTVQPPTIVTICAACHGLEGEGGTVEVPILAGQRGIYLRQQLIAFRTGQRKHPDMRLIARKLTDREIDQIVIYYSTLPPR